MNAYEFDFDAISYADREFTGWLRITDHKNIEDDIFIYINTAHGDAYIADFDNSVKIPLAKHQEKNWIDYAVLLFEEKFYQKIEEAEEERKIENEWALDDLRYQYFREECI